MRNKLVAGVDYGSDSVRVLLLDAVSGESISEGVSWYPRWRERLYCDESKAQYRQHAFDYLECLQEAMKSAINNLMGYTGQDIIGLAIDTTGSTPCPVDQEGTPLCLLEEFKENPNAMFHLWKDHTAIEEAQEINQILSSGEIDYTKYQGIYSSEWYWAKILHTTRIDESIRNHAWMWVEHCDWIVGELSGNTKPDTLYKSACAAGHKALWHSAFQGLPSKECFTQMDEYLGIIHDRYGAGPVPAGTCVGNITEEWAEKLNINSEAKIGMGSFDAHAGGVGAGVALGTMVKVIGTSTVDMLIEEPEKLSGKNLRAYCGQAENSIVPGYVGVEMSQPAFGDVYAWLNKVLNWSLNHVEIPETLIAQEDLVDLKKHIQSNVLRELGSRVEEYLDSDVVAVDWFNGRRYPNLNENVKAGICGLTLGTSVEEIYAALIKGTVFGSKRIYNSLLSNGLKIDRMIAVGGIAQKSDVIMQCMSDALGIPIMVCKDEQTCAKGAAIYAAVASGIYASIEEAQRNYCEEYKVTYIPNVAKKDKYEEMYEKYLLLGDTIEHELKM